MRYEETEQTSSKGVQSGLREFLIEKAMHNKVIFNSLYWSLQLESENDLNDVTILKLYKEFCEYLLTRADDESP